MKKLLKSCDTAVDCHCLVLITVALRNC